MGLIEDYKLRVDERITNQEDPNTIPPETIGKTINELADIVKAAVIVGAPSNKGIATPSMDPSPLEANSTWDVITPGIYTHFGGVELASGNTGKIYYDGSEFTIDQVETPQPENKIEAWEEDNYGIGSQVNYSGLDWTAKVDTLPDDIPGESEKWEERLPAYVSKIESADAINTASKFYSNIGLVFNGVESYPIANAAFADTGDNYSGWGSPIGIHHDFNAIKVRIKARTVAITSIYYECRITSSAGTLLKSGTISVNIAISTYQDILFDLGQVFANGANDIIWFGYKCNQKCDRFGSATGTNVVYVLNGSQTPNTWTATSSRNIWATVGMLAPDYNLTDEFEAKLNDKVPAIADIPGIKEKTDKAMTLQDIFEGTEIFSESLAAVIDTAGGFSGWAVPIGIQHNFSHIAGKVKALANPITAIYFELREVDKVGPLLASGTLAVNIGANELVDIVYPMGLVIENAENAKLWFGFKCNQNCGHYGNIAGTSFPYPANAQAAYTTGGNLTPGTWSYVTTPGTRNGWFKVGIQSTLPVPTEDFMEQIAGNLPIPTVVSIPEIILPDKIYAIVGDTLQLFWRGIIKAVDPYQYDIVVNCAKGAKERRYFEYTPVIGDVGSTNFQVKVKTSNGVLLASKTVILVTRNAVASPIAPMNVMDMGDSFTNARIWPAEMYRRLTGTGGTPAGKAFSNINFVGRKLFTGGAVEGNSGWSWADYLTVGRKAYTFTVSGVSNQPQVEAIYADANGKTYTMWWNYSTTSLKFIVDDRVSTPPASGILTKVGGIGDATIAFSARVQTSGNPFWNDGTGALDFTSYVNKWCAGTVDVMYIMMTWNAQYGNRTDFSIFTDYAKTFFNHVHTAYPSLKIKLMGISVSDLNGGVRVDGAPAENTYTDTYGLVVTVHNMNKAYQALANDPVYSSYVEFIHVSSQVDSEYNMPYIQKAVNTRNSDVTEPAGTNDVHLSDGGYKQVGDAAYRNFVANFCQ